MTEDLSSKTAGRVRPLAIDVHAHVVVPEVYAVAAEHNIFSELPSRSRASPTRCAGKIRDRAADGAGAA